MALRQAVVLAGLVALLAVPPAAGAPALEARTTAGSTGDATALLRGLRKAVAAGRLTRGEAHEYRAIVRRCRSALPRLPSSRSANLAAVLNDAARQARSLNRPRALALFSMLEKNVDYLSVRPMPPSGTDVFGADGVVYRAGWGRGLQFHPLANFAWLNAHVSARRDAMVERLARALRARGLSRPGGLVWEYYFPFGSGRPPWTSGMAQAVAAQALARAATRLEDPQLLRAAGRAYGAIAPRLLQRSSSGPWIRLYSFSGLVVLNAQLQAVVSLANYGELADDPAAAALASRLKRSAAAMLPRFDTRYWSRYSLGRESPLKYHLYVIRLLRTLAARTGEPVWGRTADRFERYTREPPAFAAGKPGGPLYPWPEDGFRDEAAISFWLSKVSTVTLRVGGERRVLALDGGWHTLSWRPGPRRPGVYRPAVSAVDLAGNRGSKQLQPITIERDREPPDLTARVVGRRLRWRAVDGGTPWLRLNVRLRRGEVRKRLRLGIQPLSGALRLRIPRGRWHAVLVARDSSGNRATLALGPIPTPR